MIRRSWSTQAAVAVVGVLAARAVWLGWLYDFHTGPRYHVESAMMALVIVGVAITLMRAGGPKPHQSLSEPTESFEPLEPLSLWWLPVFIVAAACLYGPAFFLGYLSDDYTLRAMAQSDGLHGSAGWFFRPLPLLVWRSLLTISDSAPLLHTVNVLLHGLNGFLVAILASRLGMRRAAAFGAAVLFLTFPAAPEAVAWAAGIQDVLMTTMALGAVVAASAASPTRGRIAVICLLAGLALGSKETAICVPALIAVCWMTPSGPRLRERWWLYIALLVLTAVYLAIRLPMGLGSGYLVAPSRYLFKQLIVTAFGTLSTPWRAPASASEQWLAFLALVAIVLLLAHAFVSWRRSDPQLHRDLRLACWVLIAVAPVFTFFFISPQLEGSRYLYLAEAGWALLLADLVLAASDRMVGRPFVFACVIGAFAAVSALSVEREMRVWGQAAALRDRVLTEARAAIARQGCVSAAFTDVPDSVNGAYVFRNGFREALNLAGADSRPFEPGCDLMWTEGRFVARRP